METPTEFSSRKQGLISLSAVVVLVLALLASVHWTLGAPKPRDGPGSEVAPTDRKLFIFVIDSLRPDNVEQLPFLDELRRKGWSSVVEPCVDRLTVPCMQESFTGFQTFGLDGVVQNLVAQGQAPPSNLFADFKAAGKSVAVAHLSELTSFRPWFDHEYSGHERLDPVLGWIDDGVDVIIFDYTAFDHTTHRSGAGTKRYKKALRHLNRVGARVIGVLPDEYDVIVFGDHGHTDTGRHIQGLDVPTMVITSGKFFGRGEHPDRIPITSMRYIMGLHQGILPPRMYQGADLTSLLPRGQYRDAAIEQGFDPEVERRSFPLWGFLPAIGLAALALYRLPKRWWWAAGLGAAGAVLAGVLYIPMVTHLHYNRAIPGGMRAVYGTFALAVIVSGLVAKRDLRGAWLAAIGAGVMLPGTLYAYGLFQAVVPLTGLLSLALLAEGGLRKNLRLRWHYTLAALFFGALLYEPKVVNFELLRYVLLDPLPDIAGPLAWCGLVVAVQEGSWPKRLGLGAVAFVGALGLVSLPAPVTALLTLAVAVLLFVSPAWLPVVAAWLIPVWFSPENTVGLVACIGLGWAVSKLVPEEWAPRRVFVPLLALGLSYLTYAFTVKLRMVGIEFTYTTEWFPGDWHERLWWVIAIAVVVKVATPIAILAHVLVRSTGLPLRGVAIQGAVIRMAAMAFFVGGMLMTATELPKFRLIELLEDIAIVWVTLTLIVVACFPAYSNTMSRSPAST